MILDKFIAVGLPVSLGLIMLSMGLTLTRSDFARIASFPRAFFIGLSSQMLIVPVLALLLLQFFDLSVELAIGLLILSFSPGGTTSNLFSYLARGDAPLSIALTAAASIITPLSIPLLTEATLYFYLNESREISIPFGVTALRLFTVTVIPLLLGMYIKTKRDSLAKRLHTWVHKISVILFFQRYRLYDF